MNTIDTKRNRFFLYLFLISFVACEVVMVADYFGKQRERGFGLDWLDEKFGEKENLTAELQEDTTSDTEGSLLEKDDDEVAEKNNGENLSSEPEQDNGTAAGGSAQEEQFPRSFVTVDYDYFDDALFIGDSRTVGKSGKRYIFCRFWNVSLLFANQKDFYTGDRKGQPGRNAVSETVRKDLFDAGNQ